MGRPYTLTYPFDSYSGDRETHTGFRRSESDSQRVSRLTPRHTYLRNYGVVEHRGANGRIHIESRTKVKSGVPVSNEIRSCVYEPE